MKCVRIKRLKEVKIVKYGIFRYNQVQNGIMKTCSAGILTAGYVLSITDGKRVRSNEFNKSDLATSNLIRHILIAEENRVFCTKEK